MHVSVSNSTNGRCAALVCLFLSLHFFVHPLASRTLRLLLAVSLSARLCASAHIFEYENYDSSNRLTFSTRNNAIESRTCSDRFSPLRSCSLSCAFRTNNTQSGRTKERLFIHNCVFIDSRLVPYSQRLHAPSSQRFPSSPPFHQNNARACNAIKVTANIALQPCSAIVNVRWLCLCNEESWRRAFDGSGPERRRKHFGGLLFEPFAMQRRNADRVECAWTRVSVFSRECADVGQQRLACFHHVNGLEFTSNAARKRQCSERE